MNDIEWIELIELIEFIVLNEWQQIQIEWIVLNESDGLNAQIWMELMQYHWIVLVGSIEWIEINGSFIGQY